MSYDVYLKIDTGGEEDAIVDDVGNITYNVCSMFYKALGGEGLKGLRGMTGEEALSILTKGLVSMLEEKDEYKKLNPPNGWGSYEGAFEFLKNLKDACERHPKAKIAIC